MSDDAHIRMDPCGLPALLSAAQHLIDAARAEGIVLRLCGGLACWHCSSESARRFATTAARRYSDMDFAAYYSDRDQVLRLLARRGFIETPSTATVPGVRRTIFRSTDGELHGDVLYDAIDFCHRIDLRGRLEVDASTLPVADLLLQKLQIVQLGAKDVVDIQMLLFDYNFAENDIRAINAPRIAALCGSDWGLYHTTTLNITKVRSFTEETSDLPPEHKQRLYSQLERLGRVLLDAPKSLRWRLRSIPGDHVRWYESVDTVEVEP